jgi:guanylate kinase
MEGEATSTEVRTQHPVEQSTLSARGLVFILSGPSGVGKDTIRAGLKSQSFPISFCVTATTRAPRPNEIDGIHYRFITVERFLELEREGQLLEHAIVHGRHYGVPLSEVRQGLAANHDLFVTVDVQGGDTVRQRLPDAITIFLAPPSLEALVPRLKSRGTEDPAERSVRLATAELELQRKDDYDYVVVNEQDKLDEAVEKVKSIIIAERCRVRRRIVEL